jgi:hypothetical protein
MQNLIMNPNSKTVRPVVGLAVIGAAILGATALLAGHPAFAAGNRRASPAIAG